MSYPQPMVTISLEEYEELKRNSKRINPDPFKKALEALLTRLVKDNSERALEQEIIKTPLKENGLAWRITTNINSIGTTLEVYQK